MDNDILKDKPDNIEAREWLESMYGTLKDIAESRDGVCRHVNAARKVLGMKEWTENMIDPVPCEHSYRPVYRTVSKTSWLFGFTCIEELDRVVCTKCGDIKQEECNGNTSISM